MAKYRWEMTMDYDSGMEGLVTKVYVLLYGEKTRDAIIGRIVYKNIWGAYRATSMITNDMQNFTKLSDAKKWVEEKAGIVKRKKKTNGSDWHPFGL